MQSKATTVEAYLKELPADRREAIEAVRRVILKSMGKGYEEGMSYGMIGYFVPHSLYSAGYHCDPTKPLPFAGLASQKNHMSVYLMPIYDPDVDDLWFREAWEATGRKLDMGKCCIRFKRLDQVALDVIAEAIRRMPVQRWIEVYETTLLANNKAAAARSAARKSAGGTVKAKTKVATARSSAKGAAMSRKASSLGTAGSAAGGSTGGGGARGGDAGGVKKIGKAGQMPAKQTGPSKPAGKAGGNQVRKTSKTRSR